MKKKIMLFTQLVTEIDISKYKQKKWLEDFIEVWDKGNDVEDWLDKNEVR